MKELSIKEHQTILGGAGDSSTSNDSAGFPDAGVFLA